MDEWYEEDQPNSSPFGPLQSIRKLVLRCEFESHYAPIVSEDSPLSPLLMQQRSFLPIGAYITQLEFQKPNMYLRTSFGMLSQLLHENWSYLIDCSSKEFYSTDYRSYFSDFNRFSIHFERLLRAGADINHVLVGCEGGFDEETTFCHKFYGCHFRHLIDYDLLGGYCEQYLDDTVNGSLNVLRYTRLLLRNGLSFFYGNFNGGYGSDFGYVYDTHEFDIWREFGLLGILVFTRVKRCIRIVYQLLALGYARRELHPGDLPVRNENLEFTRDLISFQHKHPDYKSDYRCLRRLVRHFDAGPLTLPQLARIAIRRAVGGVDFARRVRKLAHLMPPPLLRYVADADELLTSYPNIFKLKL